MTTNINEDRLASLRQYVKVLESKFVFPGTKFTFGIDPLINLIPGLGSYSGLIFGMIFIFLAHTKGASGKVKILMFKNILFDFLIGALPVAGQIADFFIKSNEKNMRLLEEHILEDKHKGSGLHLIFLFVLICIAILILTLICFLWLLAKIFSLFS